MPISVPHSWRLLPARPMAMSCRSNTVQAPGLAPVVARRFVVGSCASPVPAWDRNESANASRAVESSASLGPASAPKEYATDHRRPAATAKLESTCVGSLLWRGGNELSALFLSSAGERRSAPPRTGGRVH